MKISRRHFLQAIVVTAGTIEACASDVEEPTPVPPPEDTTPYFPQSVASGDPRPDGFVLWTRVADDADPSGDRAVTVEVGLDPVFTVMVARKTGLVAANAHDNNIKVKITGLQPRTNYYYRFIYEKNGKKLASRTGRTKTAPLPTDGASLKFAIGCCQDYIGRYYNSWQEALQLPDDYDFVIFLGDYVYETTGDPSFQSPAGTRQMVFRDPAGAITLGDDGTTTYYAAQSLSNYRDLYRTIRSDRMLQQMHENFPFVFVWDDHEYSDDCYGDTATYTSGVKDETNLDRRQNAELAFFESIPMDHPDTTGDVVDFDALPRYPSTRIYRDLVMGGNLRLAIADYRTYRPDHLIPEDGYPATVVMDAAALAAAGLDTVLSSDTFAYINIDDPMYAAQQLSLKIAYIQLATAAGVDSASASSRATAVVQGNLALAYVNAVLTNPAIGGMAIDPTGKPRGLAWIHMGKRDLFSRQGSRYVVIKDALDIYAAYKFAATQGASENAYGDAQQAWLTETLAGPETWKVLVSSVSMTSLMVDLRDKTDVTDETLRNRYYLNADMWDGFPVRRQKLLQQLAAVAGGKALVVAGDIHAAFASVESGVACLTTPAISSQTIKGGSAGVVVAGGFDPTSAVYKYAVTQIDQSFREANPGIAFSDCDSHGYLVVELSADQITATFHLIPGANAETDYASKPAELAQKFVAKKFLVTPGTIVPA